MAAACSQEETESFVTCSICLCEFDAEIRKPKFLPCAHTLCLKCLKEIHRENYITCPLCRKGFSHQGDVSSLPSNSYALHMLQLTSNKSSSPVAKTASSQGKPPGWCLTCGAVAKQGCSSAHSIIDVTANTVKNFESLLKLRDDIKKMREQGQTNLAMAISKRKEVQAHLTQLSLSLNMALNEVNQLEDQNNVQLMEMVSQLEASSSHLKSSLLSTSEGQEDPLLSELISLVDDSQPEDSLDTLKEKMKKSIQSSEFKLGAANALLSKLMYQKKCRISVRVADSKNQPVPTWDLMENGFNTYWPGETSLTPTKRDFLLLSHIVFSIQKRGLNKNTATCEPGSPLKSSKSFTPSSESKASHRVEECLIRKPAAVINPPVEKFDIRKSIFSIAVRRHGALKGEIHIKLSTSCDSPFIQELGKICFRSPKPVSDMIGKAVAEIFFMIPAFKYFGNFSYEGLKSLPPVRHYLEAGISLWIDEKSNAVGGWSFVFPLQHYEHKRSEVHVKTIQPVHFIGQVTKGIDIIEMLSWTTKQQRDGYSFLLESRQI